MSPARGVDAGDPAARLATALRRRVELIADHALRDRDPTAHLEALRTVSDEIGALAPQFGHDPRLQHFLDRCSYDKALVWLESGREN